MNVLVLNCGSSSIKFQLIDTNAARIAAHNDRVLMRGQVEKIGSGESVVTIRFGDDPSEQLGGELLTHQVALARVFELLKERKLPVEAVGHRVVHGGERMTESREITPDVLRAVETAIPLAPLHNPANLKGYKVCKSLYPDLPQVAVFDTAFHHTLPRQAFLYALPYDYYRKQGIRRYGFHGTSVRYVFYRYRELTGVPKEKSNLIVAHLGNGCSITAIKDGKSVDTSMGFTPLEGLVMGTRCGDIDPSILLHLMSRDELAPHEISTFLNRWCGLFGLSGESNDMRTLLEHMADGDERCRMAVEVFCYRLRKYIGAYWAAIGRLDAVIFTGGIGENAALVRAQTVEDLDMMGLSIDPAKNAERGEIEISGECSRVKVWVIPTNEELLIARDTFRILNGLPLP
jgi:acetate kinase